MGKVGSMAGLYRVTPVNIQKGVEAVREYIQDRTLFPTCWHHCAMRWSRVGLPLGGTFVQPIGDHKSEAAVKAASIGFLIQQQGLCSLALSSHRAYGSGISRNISKLQCGISGTPSGLNYLLTRSQQKIGPDLWLLMIGGFCGEPLQKH